MIDIHCHLLFGVDDGSDSIEESAAMLERAARQGVTKIILTPHYRHRMFSYPKEEILAHFEALKPYAQAAGIGIYLGCEYHVDSQIIEHMESGRTLTLAGGSYVLTEYSHITEYPYIIRMTQTLLLNGYRPVIAHTERYPAITEAPERAGELRKMGAMIQVNSDAVLGKDGRAAKNFCKKLLKAGNVDVVASDSHGIARRVCSLGECESYLSKKYGPQTAQLLLSRNPGKIILDV